MNFLQIPTNCEKEVFTVKLNAKYYAVVKGDECVYLSLETFDSPLKASNHARSLKRELQSTPNVKKRKNKSQKTNARKIKTKITLFHEAEMSSVTKLKLREVWVITNARGKYASDVLTNGTVVNYVNTPERADIYKSFEEANLTLNTLDMVIKKGHKLQRFYCPRDQTPWNTERL